MAEPILLDRYRDNTYNQNQIINDKLDFLIGEMRDMKQDIRALDKKIDNVRTELKSDISKVDEKIDNVRTELKTEFDKNHAEIKEEISNARWQIFVVMVGAVCSVGAVVCAVVSALK